MEEVFIVQQCNNKYNKGPLLLCFLLGLFPRVPPSANFCLPFPSSFPAIIPFSDPYRPLLPLTAQNLFLQYVIHSGECPHGYNVDNYRVNFLRKIVGEKKRTLQTLVLVLLR